MKSQVFILCDVILLVRLQGKFGISITWGGGGGVKVLERMLFHQCN